MDIHFEITQNLIYKNKSGSRSYGINTAISDEDALGVFIAHPVHLMSVNAEIPNHYKENDTDTNYVSLPKFARHLYEGSHFWIEPLFVRSEDILIQTKYFQSFIENRNMFLTQTLVNKSLGFMGGMIHFAENASIAQTDINQAKALLAKRKAASHAVRVGNMISEMLDTSNLRVYRHEEKKRLLGIKTGTISLEEACEESRTLIKEIEYKKSTISLPEFIDKAALDDMILQSTIQYWKDKQWI